MSLDINAVFNVVTKGLSVVEQFWENRDLALSIFQSVKNIADNKDTVTQDDLDAVESDLDAKLNEFNTPIPPE